MLDSQYIRYDATRTRKIRLWLLRRVHPAHQRRQVSPARHEIVRPPFRLEGRPFS